MNTMGPGSRGDRVLLAATIMSIVGTVAVGCKRSEDPPAKKQPPVVAQPKPAPVAKPAVVELAPTEPPAPVVPNWEPFERTDKMDDSKAIGIKIRSPESVEGTFGRPYQPRLWIFCADNKTEVRIDLGTILDTEVRSWESDDAYGYSSGVAVRLRLDQEKAAANFGNPSTDGTSVFLRNPVAVAKKMIGKNALLVEYAPVASARRTVTFSITGFGDAVGTVRKACKW